MPTDMVSFDDINILYEYQKKLNVDNYLIVNKFSTSKEISEFKKKMATNFEICQLIDRRKPDEINKFYNVADYIAVLGGDVSINKFAASNRKVDFLVRPVLAEKLSFDTAIANLLKQNEISVVLPFSQLLNATTLARAILLRNYAFVALVCKKFEIPFHIFSFAKKKYELRSPQSLNALKNLLERRNGEIIKIAANSNRNCMSSFSIAENLFSAEVG